MTEKQLVFEARDLWASQVPYSEPDKVEAVSVMRTVYHAARVDMNFDLAEDAEVVPAE